MASGDMFQIIKMENLSICVVAGEIESKHMKCIWLCIFIYRRKYNRMVDVQAIVQTAQSEPEIEADSSSINRMKLIH